MYQHDHVLRLVALIYDAALNAARWQAFLRELAFLLRAQGAVLWSIDSSKPALLAGVGMSPDSVAAFKERYFALDPWAGAAAGRALIKPGFAELGENLVSAEAVRKTEYYNDFGRPFNLVGGVAAVVSDDSRILLGVHQARFGQFGQAELAVIGELVPHLRRAFAVHERLTAAAALQTATADALERVPTAIFLVDGRGTPLVVNRAGRELIERRNGIESSADGLVAARADDNRALRQLIALSAATTRGEGMHAGGTLKVSRTDRESFLHLMVAPIRLDEEHASAGGAPAAMIFAHDPAAAPRLEPDILRAMFGLTPAEARVAVMLAHGRTVSEICERLAVSANTVRTHVKRLLLKTGTRTQSQLVKVLLAGLARIRLT